MFHPPSKEWPNDCPYASVEHMLQHIQAQKDWKAWRQARPCDRVDGSTLMMLRYQPDKYADVLNPTP